MESDQFFDLLTGSGTQEIKTALRAIFQDKTFDRNKYLAEAGESSRKVFYMKKGIVRRFKIRQRQGQEQEVNTGFFFEGEIIGPLHSYLFSSPVDYYLQASEPTQVWVANAFSSSSF